MTYTVSEKVHVDMRVNGEDISGDFGPGDVELVQPIADLLLASGLATEVSASKKAVKPTPTDESVEA